MYGLGPLEYINLVYNTDRFEDIKLISNYALDLKNHIKVCRMLLIIYKIQNQYFIYISFIERCFK